MFICRFSKNFCEILKGKNRKLNHFCKEDVLKNPNTSFQCQVILSRILIAADNVLENSKLCLIDKILEVSMSLS